MDNLIHYSPWAHDMKDLSRIIFLVGMCPGKQRARSRNYLALQGNRTGDLISEAIQGIPNVYLTNIFNVLTKNPTKQMIEHGLHHLEREIANLQPVRVVLLGKWTADQYRKLKLPVQAIGLEHPSFILRFNKDKAEYLYRLREALTY